MTRKDNSYDHKIVPSQFMKKLRPEYYSDTEDRVKYILDAPILEYHLESITSRNQTHDFEIFCRKLCERTICPNLRAHTGPDGGGDSKADTETHPVAEEIAVLFFIGETEAAKERWAFAFSAKKKWSTKVRDDVRGIVETGRDYKRIFFVTSRFTRDKDRARIEDELSEKYKTQVTIHDRSWIVKEIIENDRKDIAYNYLKIGEAKNDPLRLGPTDYSRTRHLAEIEKAFDDPDAFKGMERQRVTEALIAAKLSRNLERLRIEIDGRFDRAIRLAEADGTYRQELEAKYERIWTAFWWFDDFQFLKNSYETFEALVVKSDDSINLEFLCNLNQLLVNSFIHNHMSREECKLDERIDRLKKVLEKIASNKGRPNNALEAETSLLIIQMNQIILDNKRDELPDIWNNFSSVIERAKGLGEFKADRLVQMVEVAGNIAGGDPAYSDLVDKTAEFVSDRKSEAEGALILLKRAQQLDFENNFEMIRLLGKAAIGLTKKEYTDYLIEALQLLMLAYRSAGLLWASRASCTFLAASLVVEGEEDSELPVIFIPTMKIWAWIALELLHIPDFLYAIQMLNGTLATLPLSDESKDKVHEDIRELDMALGCLFLNLNEINLSSLETLPDILDALGLFYSRLALLYALGHIDTMRADGSLPEAESDEDVNQLLSLLASQPIAQSLSGPLILNTESQQTFSTNILGMTIEISIEDSAHSVLVAEAVLGSLEAFFATAIEKRIVPHTEVLKISIRETIKISKPDFIINPMEMRGTITWPTDLSPRSFESQSTLYKFWVEVSGHVLGTCCVINDIETFLEKLYTDEAVQHRMTMVTLASTSYHRVTARDISRISDWSEAIKKSYKLRNTRPTLKNIPHIEKNGDSESQNERRSLPKDHRAYSVKSVIDIHAWDQARWRGTAYGQYPSKPPYIAFMFENEEGGRKIFERWIERFGKQDRDEEISLSIIQKLPHQNKHHYCVLVTSKLSENEISDPNRVVVMASRSLVMTPDSDINLKRFLESYRQLEAFYLLPAFLGPSGPPEFAFDLSISKRDLVVKNASDVNEQDIEFMALKNFK